MKKISTEEARKRKNARQKEYAKKTGYKANIKYNKENTKRYVIPCMKNTESDIIEWLDQKENKSGYLKELIRKDMAAVKMK